ncbi:Similar to phosphoglycolate phosphatase,clustered with ubiquinone biosynthesis SAM-dependent O-methyltransferase [Pseudoalteromonas luteoviolacea B = ATCC 29581]|nr:Similar to phosphoglycolate phosphatase,clustered with ubiquinone biosynthesis SAM-dependent O-methyltransferase [Pseudoalteromonas luteoviolacea B = ATCC 29581]
MSHSTPQAVLFDLDGTLLDTAPDLLAALNYVLEKHDILPIDEVTFRPTVSDGSKAMLELGFGKHIKNIDFHSVKLAFLKKYESLGCTHSTLFDGIETLLRVLELRNVKIAIVTNKPEFLAKPIVDCLPPLNRIPVVVCGDTLTRAKPHPDQLLLACEQLDVVPEKCWYVGDAERDVQAAKAAKMKAIVALWGYVPSNEIAKRWNADQYATNPSEIFHNI